MANHGRRGRTDKPLSKSEFIQAYARVVPDPYDEILQLTDSLMLTRDQVEALKAEQARYLPPRDSVLSAFADYLVSLGSDYSTKEAMRHQNDAMATVLDIGHVSIRRTLPLVLNKFQLRMLPFTAAELYDAPDDVKGMKIVGQ